MNIKNAFRLGPHLLLGAGIIAASIVALLTEQYGWWVLSAPIVLAFTMMTADMVDARARGESSGPSVEAMILGGTFVLAGAIVAFGDPSLVKMLIPTVGAGSAAVLLQRPRIECRGERRTCSI